MPFTWFRSTVKQVPSTFPSTEERKTEPDLKIYPEKLTHIYKCNHCKYEYKFDPNDKRKCSCPLAYSPDYRGVYNNNICSTRARCCHHYEELILPPCSKCGEKVDPKYSASHLVTCVKEKCSSCGQAAYVYDGRTLNGTIATGVKLVDHKSTVVCIPCLKDEVLIDTLKELTTALDKFNRRK